MPGKIEHLYQRLGLDPQAIKAEAKKINHELAQFYSDDPEAAAMAVHKFPDLLSPQSLGALERMHPDLRQTIAGEGFVARETERRSLAEESLMRPDTREERGRT